MIIKIGKLNEEIILAYFTKEKIIEDSIQLKKRVAKLADKATFVTASINSQIVGMIGFYMNNKPLCYITHVSVNAAYRRQGIASEMFSYLESYAVSQEFDLMRLEVDKLNIIAIEAYKKNGYSIVSENANSGYYMEKQLGFL